ncbi:hypothetical protein EV385_2599 [Krasilnikovia cinnamomea]|uniref:Uncharacterized protein n=1 Tax=Krasilnikovia cinnamomea TaxID=349313 RepID=A0A4Q7ZKF6_9ACTN|nr:hypothetical protein [Krasilnikovia cinnamomea]RZU50813.1 hypothetical protein EV385_2599 [Krasilnikovia cinnamomea]
MTAPAITRPARRCAHCHHDLTELGQAEDVGFGYSRDTTEPVPVPVPDWVELVFLTGRTPRAEASR